MELLQWHKVCEIGGKELHRPPVVALKSWAVYTYRTVRVPFHGRIKRLPPDLAREQFYKVEHEGGLHNDVVIFSHREAMVVRRLHLPFCWDARDNFRSLCKILLVPWIKKWNEYQRHLEIALELCSNFRNFPTLRNCGNKKAWVSIQMGCWAQFLLSAQNYHTLPGKFKYTSISKKGLIGRIL